VYVPGRWLIDLLSLCIENYKKHLLGTKKLPINLFTEICNPLEDDQYLDEGSLPTSRTVPISVGR